MTTIFHILLGLLGLSLLVLIHELGHFFAAKLCRIHVERLCLFLGKPLVSWRWGETEFGIAWLPLGGYCKMRGEQLAVQDLGKAQGAAGKDALPAGSFQAASPLQRIFVAAAGPLVNILFALLVLFLFQALGHAEIRLSNRLVVPSTAGQRQGAALLQVPSPAERAGLESGDIIVQMGGTKIDSFSALRLAVALRAGETVAIQFLRQGQIRHSKIVPAANAEGFGWIGVAPWQELVVQRIAPSSPAGQKGLLAGMRLLEIEGVAVANQYELQDFLYRRAAIFAEASEEGTQGTAGAAGAVYRVVFLEPAVQTRLEVSLSAAEIASLAFTEEGRSQRQALLPALRLAAAQLWQISRMQWQGLARILQGRLSLNSGLAGPIQISDQIGQVMGSASESPAMRWYNTWQMLSFISFMLALVNLLPLAVLDGGLILLYATEFLLQLAAKRRLPQKLVTVYQWIGNVSVIALLILVLGLEVSHYLL